MRHLLFTLCLTACRLSWAPPDESPLVATARALVDSKLLQPLLRTESRRISRFSRVAMPPPMRRLRVVDAKPVKDGQGGQFLAFALQQRTFWLPPTDAKDDADDGWQNGVSGCVYPASGEVFVKVGEQLFPSDRLLGKQVKAADPALCRPTTT